MKIIIGLKSCWKDKLRGCHDAIRETWGKDFAYQSADARVLFFMGCNFHSIQEPDHDEVVVQADDSYDGLPAKTKAIANWLCEQDTDHAFLCDTDTFLVPKILLSLNFREWDYAGRFGDEWVAGKPLDRYHDDHSGYVNRQTWPWASGGCGYFLSRRALEIVRNMPLCHWAEDFCVGQALGPLQPEIKIANPKCFEGGCTWHYCATGFNRKYDPQWMRDGYKQGVPKFSGRR